ncbi:NACHT domain-containing protein [Actinoplanes sp. LDG1-06]|uniref:NACHT domain-containing protein n=1 Tax=Paractinoplanes ovalisporus TaxID=2810368 RepID=A0ABS2AME5_9ACTN|nr:NACHT domain-containing protein [Actinoplanes ovalisporus]MBM2621017.1 NACHT domain-containing protein [Actinoplanes ovalisporus]
MVVSVYFGVTAKPSSHTPEAHLTAAAELLRSRVRTQWEQEIVTRRLEHPRPLRLRWVRTGRPAGERSPAITDGQLLEPNDPVPAAGMVRQFRELANRQLLILGDPGSGKSTLALLFTVAALDTPNPEDPVPVLLPLAQWRPDQEDLRTWAAQWISDTNPELADAERYGEDAARALVDSNRVLLVLDGLDEMHERLRVPAARHLGGIALPQGLSTVVTCRALAYEELVAEAGRLPMAAEVTISPVTVDDAIEFLVEAEQAGNKRWHKVTRAMRAEPDGPLAKALSTPLMISLARAVYEPAANHPAELARFSSRAEVEEHLLDQFLITAYGGRDEAGKPERWLTTLARHLRHRLFSPTLTWWDLPRAVPSSVIVGTVTAVIGLVGLISCTLITPFPADNAVLGLALGLGAGIVSGLGAGRSRARRALPRTGRLRRAGSIAATTARDALAAVVLATLVTEVASRAGSGAYQDPVEALTSAVFVAALAGAFSLINTVLSTWRSALPTRPSWNLRRLPAQLLSGIATGLTFALPVGLLVGVVAGINSLNSGESIAGSLLFGGGWLALITAIAITVGIGLPIGVGRWLATPLDGQDPVSPRSVLRSDRLTCFVIAVAAGVSVGSGIALVATVEPALIQFAGYGGGPAIGPALFGGLAVFGSVLLGAGSPWTSYTVARIWLALWGLLPWRILSFLENAHERGVLRQVGPDYEFRHLHVQRHLAGRPDLRRRVAPRRVAREYANPRQQARSALTDRRRSRVGTVAACAVLPLAVGTLTVPVVRDEFTLYFSRLRDQRAALLDARADELDTEAAMDALRLRIAAREIDSDRGAAHELGAAVETMGASGVDPVRFRSGPIVRTGHWALTSGPDEPVRAWDLSADRPSPREMVGKPGQPELLNVGSIKISHGDGTQTLLGYDDDTFWSRPIPAGSVNVACLGERWCSYSNGGDTYVFDLRRPDSALVRIGVVRWLSAYTAPGWLVYERADGVLLTQPLTTATWEPVEIGPSNVLRQTKTRGVLSFSSGGRGAVRVLDTGRVIDRPNTFDLPLGEHWFVLLDASGSAMLHHRSTAAKDVFLGDDVTDLRGLPDASLAVLHSSGKVDRWRISAGRPVKQAMLDGIADLTVDRNRRIVTARLNDGTSSLVDLSGPAPKIYPVGRGGKVVYIGLTDRWAFVVADAATPSTELWDIGGVPRRIGDLAGLPLSASAPFPIKGYDIDAGGSWIVMRRNALSPTPLDLWHLGNNPKHVRLSPVNHGGPYFAGPYAMEIDDAGSMSLFDLPQSTAPPHEKVRREYVSGLQLADNGAWGLFEHGDRSDGAWKDLLVTVRLLQPAPAILRPDAWAVACTLVGQKPLSKERWQQIVPDVPYREICRSKVY